MAEEMSRDEAFRKLSARCMSRECCVSEAREKMRNWNVSRVDADCVIERLISERFIDEERYAQAFATDQFRFAGWGRIKIGYTLRQKGIDSLIVSQAVHNIDAQEYHDALMCILNTKMRALKMLPPHAQAEKLMRFAISRGFEPEIIRANLKELSLQCEVGSEI